MYDIFKKIIDDRGITIYRVSKDTGILTSTLYDWKSGKTKPKLDKLQKIATYLNIPLEKLIKEGDEK